MDKVFCPDCQAELLNVYSARSVELQKEGDKWIEKNVFLSACSCPQCHADLDAETLDKLGVPVEYR